ncbi:S-layer homology domain-containing protein [Paenibacillus glycanilyticus]|uniref:S-layer homology domain-containing protein n=1 Tax=Paenibacillus glycanilyticus TaxID=126569 RepID=UPI00203E3E5A|nr:S-layer homology domain-containing protein [Paenibacillus glycanilyticus]MCM3626405.1 S-layer homology domain-containing protein [Paenibacillus glycanilyticus]
MKIKAVLLLAVSMLLVFTLGQTVFAFSDTSKDPNKSKIEALEKQGVIKGDKGNKFNSNGKLTYAAGVSMLVKAFHLNIDNIRFIKEPKVSDYYPNLKDNAWYADAFIIAQYNGLEVPKNVKANDEMTREQFAHHLFKAIVKQGDFAFIELYMTINDEKNVNKDYMDSIQKLLISKIATLDKKNNFYPKQKITRGVAAGWLYDGLEFVKNTPTIPEVPSEPAPQPIQDLKLTVTSVNKDINKVTVTGQAPNPGYGLRIAAISFVDGKAVIKVETVQPDPNKMYPQVITEVSASTYVDAALKPVLAPTEATASGDAAVSSPALAS